MEIKPQIQIKKKGEQYYWWVKVFGCNINWGLVKSKPIHTVIQESVDQFTVLQAVS